MKAMKNLSEIEKAMLKDIYTSYDTMADSVYHVAKKLQIDQEVIWTLINEVSYRVVRNRGLI
jgi:energy-converting hydrogenase A subunit M